VVINELPFLLTDTVGFIRKLPHTLVESFKSTLDEVRESDLLIHIVDISHNDFEEHIAVVTQTLTDIGASDKPVVMLFNKIDAYRYTEKEEDDLSPVTKEQLSLDELKNTWMARANLPSLFISAREKTNIDQLREVLYSEALKIRQKRYPNLIH
jgi:GTP-binding protein HflX